MGPVKKITYNCKKATFLIEKKLIGRITLREHIELRVHLLGCSVCRIYKRQAGKINEMVRQFFYGSVNVDAGLDDRFKKDLQERIENELKKK